MAKHKSIPPATPEVVERFWSKVVISSDGCWEWKRALSATGYGVFKIGGVQYFASRVAAVWSGIVLLDDQIVCHHCDNSKCVRPTHLFIGSHADNANDRNSKGRQARGARLSEATRFTRAKGERVNTSKLTAVDVLSIRGDWASGESCSSLARKYSVAHQSIQKIVDGKNWKHLPITERSRPDLGGRVV